MEPGHIAIVRDKILRSELADIASHQFGDMVKAVVDVERMIMAIGGELHSDEEAMLIDDGSNQRERNVSFTGHTADGLRWSRFGLLEQMANIGSEVDRAIRAHDNGQTERARNAMDRALALFDLTAADERWRGHRRREILRAREEFCRIFFDHEEPGSSPDLLRRYFLAFAVAARAR